jgi:hypothetical protein
MIRDRAKEERGKSRDANVAKLLNARKHLRMTTARAAIPALDMLDCVEHVQGPNRTAEQHPQPAKLQDLTESEHEHLVLLDPLEPGTSSPGGYAGRHQDSKAFASQDAVGQAEPGPGINRVHAQQHTAIVQAKQHVQGMLVNLQDTLATLEAVRHQ